VHLAGQVDLSLRIELILNGLAVGAHGSGSMIEEPPP
jgi:hypothetical protein